MHWGPPHGGSPTTLGRAVGLKFRLAWGKSGERKAKRKKKQRVACRRAHRKRTGQSEVGWAARGGTRSARWELELGSRGHHRKATTEGPTSLAPAARARTDHRTELKKGRKRRARPPRDPGGGEREPAARGRADGRTGPGEEGVSSRNHGGQKERGTGAAPHRRKQSVPPPECKRAEKRQKARNGVGVGGSGGEAHTAVS